MTIPALHKGSERPKEELANTLYYLVNTVSEEVRENGFCIVVDSRGYSWQTVKQTLRMLQVRVCVVCMCVLCVHVCVVYVCLCVLCLYMCVRACIKTQIKKTGYLLVFKQMNIYIYI